MLQKPNPTGSTTSHSEHLERRLSLWRTGSIPELFEEAICIQNHLPIGDRKRKEKRSGLSDSVFSGVVFSWKINAAVRYVCEKSAGGVFHMDDRPDPHSLKTVQDILLEKHPVSAEPSDFALLSREEKETNLIVFERLTRHLIKDIARVTPGSQVRPD